MSNEATEPISYPCKGRTKAACKPGEMVQVEICTEKWEPTGEVLEVQSLLYCGAGKWCQLNLFQFAGDNFQRPALCTCEE